MAAMLSWAATVYPMDGTWVPIIWDPNTPLEDTMDDDSHGSPPSYHATICIHFLCIGIGFLHSHRLSHGSSLGLHDIAHGSSML